MLDSVNCNVNIWYKIYWAILLAIYTWGICEQNTNFDTLIRKFISVHLTIAMKCILYINLHLSYTYPYKHKRVFCVISIHCIHMRCIYIFHICTQTSYLCYNNFSYIHIWDAYIFFIYTYTNKLFVLKAFYCIYFRCIYKLEFGLHHFVWESHWNC